MKYNNRYKAKIYLHKEPNVKKDLSGIKCTKLDESYKNNAEQMLWFHDKLGEGYCFIGYTRSRAIAKLKLHCKKYIRKEIQEHKNIINLLNKTLDLVIKGE